MLLTLSLTALGALLSALASWGSTDTVYIIICASRFLMGMGVGGVYPLSATKAAEETGEGDDSQLRVSWCFFWQTPGESGFDEMFGYHPYVNPGMKSNPASTLEVPLRHIASRLLSIS